MAKFYDDEFYGRGTECQYEPNVAPILCFECEQPTGETGTCTDSGLCPKCRTEYEGTVGFVEIQSSRTTEVEQHKEASSCRGHR